MLFTAPNCRKAVKFSVVFKQIAKFITITSSKKNINTLPVS